MKNPSIPPRSAQKSGRSRRPHGADPLPARPPAPPAPRHRHAPDAAPAPPQPAPRPPRAAASRCRTPPARRVAPAASARSISAACSAVSSATSAPSFTKGRSGCRRIVPVAEQGASSSTASNGPPLPRQRIRDHHLGRQPRPRKVLRHPRHPRGRDIERRHLAPRSPQAASSCRPARRTDRAPAPPARRQQPRRQGGGGVLHPPTAPPHSPATPTPARTRHAHRPCRQHLAPHRRRERPHRHRVASGQAAPRPHAPPPSPRPPPCPTPSPAASAATSAVRGTGSASHFGPLRHPRSTAFTSPA